MERVVMPICSISFRFYLLNPVDNVHPENEHDPDDNGFVFLRKLTDSYGFFGNALIECLFIINNHTITKIVISGPSDHNKIVMAAQLSRYFTFV